MANIGLKQFTFGELKTEGSSINDCIYDTPQKLAGAIECSVSLNTAEGSLYADDGIDSQVTELSSATITLGISEDDDTIFAKLLGNTTSELENVTEIISKSSDSPIPVGFGHIISKMSKNVRKFKVEFFPKVTFKPFMADASTRGDSLEFSTPSVEGTVFPLEDGTWEKHATFDNIDDAKTYLTNCFKKN